MKIARRPGLLIQLLITEHIREHRGGKVALTGVWQYHHNGLAGEFRQLLARTRKKLSVIYASYQNDDSKRRAKQRIFANAAHRLRQVDLS